MNVLNFFANTKDKARQQEIKRFNRQAKLACKRALKQEKKKKVKESL